MSLTRVATLMICGLSVLIAAGCSAPEGGRDPRIGLAASVLPNAGLEAQGSILWKRRATVDWHLEASITQQVIDDTDFATDGNPAAGDFTQAGLSLRAVTAARDRRHWTLRTGVVWFRARGEPNVIDEPGDYFGLRIGVGFETDLSPRWSMGPELAVIPAWGEGEFVILPQVTWGVRWRL